MKCSTKAEEPPDLERGRLKRPVSCSINSYAITVSLVYSCARGTRNSSEIKHGRAGIESCGLKVADHPVRRQLARVALLAVLEPAPGPGLPRVTCLPRLLIKGKRDLCLAEARRKSSGPGECREFLSSSSRLGADIGGSRTYASGKFRDSEPTNPATRFTIQFDISSDLSSAPPASSALRATREINELRQLIPPSRSGSTRDT